MPPRSRRVPSAENDLPTPSLPSTTTATTSSSFAATTGNTCTTPVLTMSREEESHALLVVSRNHLQCPVCLDTIRVKPIFQCGNGHTICSSCIPRLNACPVCRASLVDARIRNRALETLMDHVQVPCPYQSNGCMQTVKRLSLKEHILECEFGEFIVCPGLGFENCTVPLSPENWISHVSHRHELVVNQERCTHVTITYAEFLPKYKLKGGCLLKWESIVLKPFADAGPFIIMCEMDVEKNCTATFTCIHAPLNRITTQCDEVDANDDESMQTTFYVKFSIGGSRHLLAPECGPQHTTTWKGESALYSEYRSGSAKGRFQVPLSEYIYPDEFTPEDIATTDAVVGNQSFKIRIRFAKSLQELQQPSSSIQTSLGLDTKCFLARTVIYGGIKCDHCSEKPLLGTRFRCSECSNFNLCYRCWSEKNAHSHHNFVCVRNFDQKTRMTKNFKHTENDGVTADENRPINARKTSAASAGRKGTLLLLKMMLLLLLLIPQLLLVAAPTPS